MAPEARSRVWALGVALALMGPWALACGPGSAPTAPEAVAIEDISEAEIVVAGDLEALTEEQREQVRRILRQARFELLRLRRAVRAGEITPEQARRRARAIHGRTIQRLSELLTEEQLETLLERLRERRSDRPDLDLTEEQKAAITALRGEFRAFADELRDQVRAGTLSAAEARRRIRAAWREMLEAICGILTDEQAGRVPFCGADAGASGGPRGDGPRGGGPPGG